MGWQVQPVILKRDGEGEVRKSSYRLSLSFPSLSELGLAGGVGCPGLGWAGCSTLGKAR